MDETIYQAGYEVGKSWAEQDATPEQLLLVHELGDGKTWVVIQLKSSHALLTRL